MQTVLFVKRSIPMDDLDRKILSLLAKNARMPVKEKQDTETVRGTRNKRKQIGKPERRSAQQHKEHTLRQKQ